ncbi:MAG: maltose alpha-D-glucosyltransferase [Chloroflexi bacterium]|nr:maltose alpha-D-glucosyltransferase [Chloroflexota bacterium]
MSSSPWYQTAIFYELYVRAFQDSNGDGHGDLRGVIERMDYLANLGIDCIWLLPTYPSPLVDDGYDIADYYNVHPDYGDLQDYRDLIEAAHARGIRVIADLVMNHTSDQHPWFQASRRRVEPFTDFYVWSDTDEKYSDARIIFLDTESSNWAWDELRGQYYWHRFYSQQPDLNFDNPAVQQEMLDIARFWLDMGLDGFRADAVPYLFEREGTNCENLPETHAYLKRLRAFVDAHYPQALLLCEANQWPEDVRAYFGGDPNDPAAPGDEFHMCFHFPVMPRLYMALRRGDRSPVVQIMERTPAIPPNCQWCTFLRNHDELTLEMVTEVERQWMWTQYAPEPRMRLNLGIRRRLAPLLDNDRRKIELMNSLLFTLPGAPILYYGDEIGMGDNIWLPDRMGVRTPMQWDDSANAGFSSANKTYAPVIDDPVFGYQRVNVAAQQADPDSLYHVIRRFITVYKAQPALALGELRFLEHPNPSLLGFERVYNDQRLLCLHNLSDSPIELSTPAAHDLLTGADLPPGSLTLPPYGHRWLALSAPDATRQRAQRTVR